jgi:Protein of unknown function (DUF429)
MPLKSVHIGIDVACALGKPLPICVVSADQRLMPLKIPKHLSRLIPRGLGNKEITAARPFRSAASGVANSINTISEAMKWKIEGIAIDAPAAPPSTGSRASEIELSDHGLSSFRTPATSDWPAIIEKCTNHLSLGHSVATLPYANKIWMLFGFELFSCLKSSLKTEIIEVYPFAIVRSLLPTCMHKSTEQGYQDQLAAVAARNGWEPWKLEAELKAQVAGSRHDRLDAFMAAWIASLPLGKRRAFGNDSQPDDAIWVPL